MSSVYAVRRHRGKRKIESKEKVKQVVSEEAESIDRGKRGGLTEPAPGTVASLSEPGLTAEREIEC